MPYPGWQVRDQLAPHFRFRLLTEMEVIPYHHQAQIFAWLDGKDIAEYPTCGVHDVNQPHDTPLLRTWIDDAEHWLVAVPQFVNHTFEKYGEEVTEPFPAMYPDEDAPIINHGYFAVVPNNRPRVQVISASGAFKIGKSIVGGVIPASFSITPGLLWDIYGTEYDITEPELQYVLDALLSEKGLNLPKVKYETGNELVGYLNWKSDPTMGRMYLNLSNGAKFTCRSFRKALETKTDPLKGKERDGFSIAEVYQFPSVQSLMSYRQNLAARRGYYVMPSTPDRPIMDEINERSDPDNDDYETWLGIKNIHRRENPMAFRFDDFMEDLNTFTREEFTVYWEGRSGRWIGAVYPPVQYFDTHTHPHLWKDPDGPATIENFRPPPHFKRLGGADTATLFGIVTAVADELGNVFFCHASCNYRYIAGRLEQLFEIDVSTVCSETRAFRDTIGGKFTGEYCDHNTQWKDEFRRNGIILRKGCKDPEQRCEATRAMAQNGFLWFAPWLRGSELVEEFQMAKYPPRVSSTKRERRIDENDHLLDSAEHLCAKHPHGRRPKDIKHLNPVRALMAQKRRRRPSYSGDPQIGG